jgi:ubiquinone/menaquinone biosynthesis C-methylase UbiE
MDQKDIFFQKEGNEYYKRNTHKIHDVCNQDKIISSLQNLCLKPKCILEIGCSNGWRLNALHAIYNSECYGIDPSETAIKEGGQKFAKISLQQGTAERLPFADGKFDLVIFGFCLYLCDRGDLFSIAKEGDRVLSEGGIMTILDFEPPFPYRNEYKHDVRIQTYKMNYANMFAWDPKYTIIYKLLFSHSDDKDIADPDERVSVVFMKKDSLPAYPANPFKK